MKRGIGAWKLWIPPEEFELTFARSSGPGGQNVNKVNSKVVLRWQGLNSPSLPPDVRQRLAEQFASRLTQSGELLITSDRSRDRGRNAEDCLDKLRAILEQIARAPKARKPTKPTRGSSRRRLEGKRIQSDKKRGRSGNFD